MNISASIMTTLPVSTTTMTIAFLTVSAMMFLVAGTAVKNAMQERRAVKLNAAQANPELEAFGFPMPSQSKQDKGINMGAILKSKGYSV